jgi:hypothetical protein
VSGQRYGQEEEDKVWEATQDGYQAH